MNAERGKLAGKILAFLCLTTSFLTADQFGNFTYTDDGTSITITDYPTTATGAVVIPETIAGKPVTAIGSSAFDGCTSVTDLTIPLSVVSIGSRAFLFCKSMVNLTIPPGLTAIGDNTFWGCSSLTGITIPSGVTDIGSYAFYGCASLTNLTIPPSVVSIGSSAFSSCRGLIKLTLYPGLTAIGDDAFSGCTSLAIVSIPSGVTSLGKYAFEDCSNITDISLPAGLINIGQNAFARCIKLTFLTIPPNVASIGENAFAGCTGLFAIDVDPGNMTYSSVDGVLFNKSKTRLIRYPVAASASYTIPSSVTVIDDFAFSSCKNLVSVTLPAGVTQIGEYAFVLCHNLAGVTFPEGLTMISDYAFFNCISLKSVIIPSNVTRLGTYAFGSCEALESVSILSNAPAFGWLTFRDNYLLRTMSFAGNAPTVDRDLAKSPLPNLQIYYFNGKTGFTSPTWYGYPTVNMGNETPVSSWLMSKGLPFDSDLNSDPNQDGVNILMAYALDLDPNKNLAGSMPRPVIAGNQMSLRFFAGRAGVTYTVQVSEDMHQWGTEGVNISGPDENQFRTATVDVSGRARFVRLVVRE